MTEEKATNARTVTTDALETLGKIHTRVEKRDAIHLAVEPVVAGEHLEPGDTIIVTDGVAYYEDREKALGIVDPFLEQGVRRGQRFWFVMFPRAVHSLRHVWTHPAFPDVEEKPPAKEEKPPVGMSIAEFWIRGHAEFLGLSYEQLMESAKVWLKTGEYYVQLGEENMQEDFEPATFWRNYEIVTGEKVPENEKHSFFSCSC
jgi:hypothetical protein